jgi:hypothetical protein
VLAHAPYLARIGGRETSRSRPLETS